MVYHGISTSYRSSATTQAIFIFYEMLRDVSRIGARRWAFQVQLAPNSGVEFAPGEFAAESEAMRDRGLEHKVTVVFHRVSFTTWNLQILS